MKTQNKAAISRAFLRNHEELHLLNMAVKSEFSTSDVYDNAKLAEASLKIAQAMLLLAQAGKEVSEIAVED